MFKKITLDNGLRIVLTPQKESLSATVLVLVEAGSKNETKEISGISHFLEHMCFKGTKKRPKAMDIASELDALGAIYNAFTGLERTGYYIKAKSDYLDNILDIVSDIYLNQKFDAQEADKEKGIIIEEINMINDDPSRKVWDHFTELLYGDQPAGWDVAGTAETVTKMSQEDLVKYHKEHYVADSTVVVVAGDFNKDEVVEKIKNYFANIPSSKKIQKSSTIERQEKPEVSAHYKETDQTHLILGVRAFDNLDKRKYVLMLLADILGGGSSSRLFQRIREDMGAAYYVYADADLYSDHGFLAVAAGADNKKTEKVVDAIVEEIRIMAGEPVSEAELERAKKHLTGNLVISLETSNQLAGFYGSQEISTGKILAPEDLIEKVENIKAEEILEVAKDIFKNEKLNLALIGPFKEKEKFEKILKI